MRLQRGWKRSAIAVTLTDRRLRLSGLSAFDRAVSVLAILAAVLSGAVIVHESRGTPRLHDFSVAAYAQGQPTHVFVALLVGLGTTQLCLVAAASLHTGARRTAMLLLAVVLAAAPMAELLHLVRVTGGYYEQKGISAGGGWGVLVTLVVLGALSVVLGLTLSARASRGSSSAGGSRWWVLLFAVPFVLVAAMWLGLRLVDSSMSDPMSTRLPDEVASSVLLEAGLSRTMYAIAGVGLAITAWQVIEATRAAYDASRAGSLGGARIIRRLRRGRWGARLADPWSLVLVILLIKLTWIVLGVADVLPSWLGGDSSVWADMRADGLVSGAFAVVTAVLFVGWLRRGCPGPRESRGVLVAAAVVVAALSLAEVSYQVVLMLAESGAGSWGHEAGRTIERLSPWSTALAVVTAIAFLAVSRYRGTHSAGVVFLTTFAVWAGWRALAIGDDLIRFPWFPWGVSIPSEELYGQRVGWVNTSTLDLMLTLALVGVSLAALRGSERVRFTSVLLVGIVVTLVGFGSEVVQLAVATAAGAGLVFTLSFVYLLLFDAEPLNRPHPGRPARVLGVLGLMGAALCVGVFRAESGSPIAEQDQAMAAALLTVPALITWVVVALARMGPPSTAYGSRGVTPSSPTRRAT